MSVSGTGRAKLGTPTPRVQPAGSAAHSTENPPSESRALTPIEVAERPRQTGRSLHHAQAPFLAQLLAEKLDMPQSRRRWRAPAEAATARYRRQGEPARMTTMGFERSV